MRIITLIILSFFIIIGFIGFIYFLTSLNIPTPNDVPLSNGTKIYAGYRESCLTPTLRTSCAKGLECVLISTEPQENGVCLKIGEDYEENYYDFNQSDNTLESQINLSDMVRKK